MFGAALKFFCVVSFKTVSPGSLLVSGKFFGAAALELSRLFSGVFASTYLLLVVTTNMSDDEVDEDLLELLRKSMGIGGDEAPRPAKTGVIEDAEYIYDNSTDVALDMQGTKAAAVSIWSLIQEKDYSMRDWSKHELHPKAKDESTVNFIFLMDLINFSFWSDNEAVDQGFAIEYGGKRWTGYWSLVAAMQRALADGIPITSPDFWINEAACTDELLRNVFRSATGEDMPLLQDRLYCIREAGYVLRDVS